MAGQAVDIPQNYELIETLWNVNKTIKYYRQEGFYELIETCFY